MSDAIDRDFWFLEDNAVWQEFTTVLQDVEDFQPTPQDLDEMVKAFDEMDTFEREYDGIEF